MKKLIITLFIMIFAIACGDKNAADTEEPSTMEKVTKGYIDTLKEQHKGKTIIVNFFASWCPPCRGETPDFIQVYNENKDNDFVIVGISVDKTAKEAESFVKEFGVTYPVVLGDAPLGEEMKISTIPTSFIYKPDGKLFDIVVGPLTKKELDIIARSFK